MTNTSFRPSHLSSLARSNIALREKVEGNLPKIPQDLDQPQCRRLSFSGSVLRAMPRGPIAYRGQRFFSRSEAACAELMQKYLGFSIQDKVTINVPVGISDQGHVQSVDFRLGSTLIEYHPMIIRASSWKNADRQTKRELSALHRQIRSRQTPRKEREQARIEARDTIADLYTKDRQKILQRNLDFKDAELIVARDPEDFYEKVMLRFSRPDLLPSREEFLSEFQSIQSMCKDLSKSGQKRAKARTHRQIRRLEKASKNRALRYPKAG